MSDLGEFLKKYSYRNISTASPVLLMNYISQLERLSNGDPFIVRLVSSLKTTPINQIPRKLAILEDYLNQPKPQSKKQSKNQKGRKN